MDQVEAPPKKKRKWPWILLGVIVLLVVIGMAGDESGTEQAASEPAAPPVEMRADEKAPTEADLALAREEALKAWPVETLPEGAPEPPVTGSCMSRVCEGNRAQFMNHDWPLAWQGDYEAQRNAAYCRGHSCDGAVQLNPIEACAWRVIVLQAHVDESDGTDTRNFDSDCGDLDAPALATARQKAESIHQRIYGKPLPTGGVVN